MSKSKPKKERPRPGHNWWFRGPSKLYSVLSKTVAGTKDIPAEVTEGDVLRAIKKGGRGHTDICAGAFCTKRNADRFPHKVTGYVDVWPTRVFISSENDKMDLPKKHHEYELKGRDAALMWQWNDSKGGLEKMLDHIRANGPLQIIFGRLPDRRCNQKGSGAAEGTKDEEGNYIGSRTGGGKKPRGHHRRYAVAQRGSYEAAKARFERG